MSQQAWEVRMALTKKAERTKAKLLASARKLIGERGFDRVSVEDITRDSGVAKGTFYHYFKCKEDVVAELSFQSSQTILEESVHFDGTADERCFHYVTALCRDADWAGVRLVRQWIREAMESEEEDSEAKACLYDIYNAIVKICAVRQGRGPGELTEDAPPGYAGQTADEPCLRCFNYLVHDEWFLESVGAVCEIYGNRHKKPFQALHDRGIKRGCGRMVIISSQPFFYFFF